MSLKSTSSVYVPPENRGIFYFLLEDLESALHYAGAHHTGDHIVSVYEETLYHLKISKTNPVKMAWNQLMASTKPYLKPQTLEHYTLEKWKCTSELNISHHLLIHCLNLEGRQQRIYFSEEVLACSCSLCCSRASCRLNRSSLSNHFENTVGLKLQYAKCSPQWRTNVKYQRNNAHFSHIESLLWIESN